jgi:hypothetical protein
VKRGNKIQKKIKKKKERKKEREREKRRQLLNLKMIRTCTNKGDEGMTL